MLTPHRDLCARSFRFAATLLIAVLAWLSSHGWAVAADRPNADRPNIVVILSDDQGWGDLSLNGNTNLSTPHIDSLARDGAQFDRFFVCPVCSPTRAEFLTGRYHPRSGVYSTSAGGERMDLDETTIGDTFKAAGYATAAFGKWHNGMQYPYHPNGRGFDEFYGLCSGHWGNYFSPQLEHNGELVRGTGYIIDDLTTRAMEFIEENREKPFFVYLPYNTPHSPMQVPEHWWRKFKDHPLPMRSRDASRENVDHTRAALAMCENIDWNVGRLLAKLTHLDLDEETIVVYFCDNGPNGFRWNGEMKGRKGSTDEGGVRSPMLIRWPGRIPAGSTITQIGAAIDLLPTLADMAGIEHVSEKPLDGISLADYLTGETTEHNDRKIFSHWRGQVSVRTQQYRLDNNGKLFDLTADPRQDHDVSAEHPEVTTELRRAVNQWKDEMLPLLETDERPFVIGHPDFANTQIPARDGTAHGNIERSNRFPNCSYFTNWTSEKDRITWDVTVAAPGTFEAEIWYTCPKADVGSTIELSLGKQKITGRIEQPHDPPLIGAAQDRVERQESYVKYFRPLKLGRITLPAGAGELTLQATDIPGSQAMDFRLLMLRRVE
ncbi:MAG: arylsulfatase [Maioricimonas sp. JB049]